MTDFSYHPAVEFDDIYNDPTVSVSVTDDSGTNIVASGSAAGNCVALDSPGRLGAPTVTDGSSSIVWVEVQNLFGDRGFDLACVVGLDGASVSSIHVKAGRRTDSEEFGLDFVRCDPFNLWVAVDVNGDAIDSDYWSYKFTLSSAAPLEIPFIGRGSRERTTFNGIGNYVRGSSITATPNTVRLGPGPNGVQWRRDMPNTYRQGFRIEGPRTSVDDLAGIIWDQRSAWPMLFLLDRDNPAKVGASAFGLVDVMPTVATDGGSTISAYDVVVDEIRP